MASVRSGRSARLQLTSLTDPVPLDSSRAAFRCIADFRGAPRRLDDRDLPTGLEPFSRSTAGPFGTWSGDRRRARQRNPASGLILCPGRDPRRFQCRVIVRCACMERVSRVVPAPHPLRLAASAAGWLVSSCSRHRSARGVSPVAAALCAAVAARAPASLTPSLFLIGDAGAPCARRPNPLLDALADEAAHGARVGRRSRRPWRSSATTSIPPVCARPATGAAPKTSAASRPTRCPAALGRARDRGTGQSRWGDGDCDGWDAVSATLVSWRHAGRSMLPPGRLPGSRVGAARRASPALLPRHPVVGCTGLRGRTRRSGPRRYGSSGSRARPCRVARRGGRPPASSSVIIRCAAGLRDGARFGWRAHLFRFC